jgi:hypothetical protein
MLLVLRVLHPAELAHGGLERDSGSCAGLAYIHSSTTCGRRQYVYVAMVDVAFRQTFSARVERRLTVLQGHEMIVGLVGL